MASRRAIPVKKKTITIPPTQTQAQISVFKLCVEQVTFTQLILLSDKKRYKSTVKSFNIFIYHSLAEARCKQILIWYFLRPSAHHSPRLTAHHRAAAPRRPMCTQWKNWITFSVRQWAEKTLYTVYAAHCEIRAPHSVGFLYAVN